MKRSWSAAAAFLLLVLACSSAPRTSSRRPESRPPEPTPVEELADEVLHGKATWYGGKFHGRKTASGERFNQNDFTAAHRKLPFGTIVRVTNLKNGRKVKVRINDRGPFGGRAIIDLSRAAAKELEMTRAGVVDVTVEVLERPQR